MSELVYLIERLSIGLYFLCGFSLLISVRRWMLAQGELRHAEFELERELALRKQAAAVTWTLGVVELALALFAVANVVAPTMRADALEARGLAPSTEDTTEFRTATPGGTGQEVDSMFATVTAQALAGGGGPSLLLTPVPTATSVGTMVPEVEALATEGCDTDQAKLQIPANGQQIFDFVTIEGRAWTESFSSYKFEISGAVTGGQFAPIGNTGTAPVREQGVLGQVPLAGLQEGVYRFRLVVFDNTATLKAFCTVNVLITRRPPTATPPGGGAPAP
jgi:hypothetical protein